MVEWAEGTDLDAAAFAHLKRCGGAPGVLMEFTDDQLRAECTRRWGEDDWPMVTTIRARAEAAEARVKSLEARIEDGYLPHIARLQGNAYGLAAWPERRQDNTIAFLDEDLLCDDA